MATRQLVTLSCDLCGTETDDVETHTLTVDGKAREVEVCARQWAALDKKLGPVLAAGRRRRKRKP